MKKEIIQNLKDLGLNLIPCTIRTKKPTIKWTEFQTNKYVGQIPESGNAAVICGRIPGCTPIIVIDLDAPELANILFDDFEKVKTQTLVVQTGKGGYHVYVRPMDDNSTTGKRLTNNKGQHIDIQGDRVYVMAPSSIHPNGNEYKIISSTTQIKQINLNAFINSLQQYGFNTEGSGLKSVDEIAKGVGHGDRNSSAYKYAMHLMDKVGITPDQCWGALITWNKLNKPPLNERELDMVYKSSISRFESPSKPKEDEIPNLKSKTEWVEWLSVFIGNNYNVDELNNKFVLNIDHNVIQHIIKKYPGSFIEMMEKALEKYGLHIRVELTMDVNTTIKAINPDVGNKILCFDTDVMAVEDRKTYTKSAVFKCPNCDALEELICNEFHVISRERCSCKNKGILEIVENDKIESDFTQNIYVRESMEEARNGSPLPLKCRLFGDIVGETYVGQKKRIIGQFRSIPLVGKRNLNEAVIDVLSVNNTDESQHKMPTEEEMNEWKERVKQKEFFDILARQEFAPDIIGNTDLKKALLLSVISAPRTQKRVNNIHVLMLGDPGTSKTTLMERANEISAKGIFTSGKGSSAAGLTGGMDRVGPNMPMVFLPGAVTVANKGVAYVDEIDKMQENDRESLLTCMAKGYVPINKVGIVGAILPADTTIIASANPKGGKPWMPDKSITVQTNLTTPLLSRFDVIWLVLDKVDEQRDMRISTHIMNEMNPSSERMQDASKLLRYINHIKTLNPELTKKGQEKITDFYVRLRKLSSGGDYVPVDPRKTEAIAKLSMSHARLYMKEQADESDVDAALQLIEASLNTFNLTMEEGKSQGRIDDVEKRNKEDSVLDCINLAKDPAGNFKLGDVVFQMLQTNIFENQDQASKYLRKWEDRMIAYNGDGTYRLII